jgi:hypothetical protein
MGLGYVWCKLYEEGSFIIEFDRRLAYLISTKELDYTQYFKNKAQSIAKL